MSRDMPSPSARIVPKKAGRRRLPKPSQETFADPKLVLFQRFVCNCPVVRSVMTSAERTVP